MTDQKSYNSYVSNRLGPFRETTNLFLGCSVFAIYALLGFKLLGPGGVAGGDEGEYLAVAHSLANDHDIYLESEGRVFEPHYPPSWKSGDYLIKTPVSGKEFFPPNYIVNVIPTKGHLLPYHPIGLSLLVLPGQMILGNFGARLVIALCASLLAINLLALSGSVTTTLILIFSPPLIYFSLLIFNEIPATLLIVFAYRKIVTLLDDTESDRQRRIGKDIIPASLAIAFLPWLHPKYLLISGLLLLLIFQKRYLLEGDTKIVLQGKNQRAVRTILEMRYPLIIAIISILALLSFYQIVYGSWQALLAPSNPGVTDPLRGILGLLIDRRYGLINNCPIYLFAIIQLFCEERTRHRDWFIPALTGVVFFGNSIFAVWHGGAAPPARLLTPALPLLGLYLPKFIRVHHQWGAPLVIAATIIGVILTTINLFEIENLGFISQTTSNTAWQRIPLGDQIQRILPNLVE